MKTTTKERLNRYKNSFLETPKNHPVEMGLALTIVFVNGFNIITNAWSHAMMLYLCILVAFIFGHYKEQLWCRVPYYATFVVGIATLFFDVKPIVNLQAFDILMYLSVVGAFIVPRSNSNNEFVARSFRLGINVALAFIVFLLFFIAYLCISFSIETIFNTSINEVSAMFENLIYPFLTLWCFFTLYKPQEEPSRVITHRVFGIVYNYIVTPALIIYTIILYLYIFKILFTGSLPEGGVSYLVFSYLIVGLISRAMLSLIPKPIFKWFYSYFTYIAIAPLLLFWYGYSYRVGEYGMTGNRFYLLILAAWLTLSMVLMETKRYNNYRFLLLFGIVVVAVFTYIPGITAHDFGKWSQRVIVKDLAAQYGTFNDKGTLITYEADGEQMRLESSVKYLENENDSVWLLENIGYPSKREMMYGVKLDYKIEDTNIRGGEYTQGENERLPIENYAYLIFNPHTSLDTTSGQFIVQLSDSVEMVLNRDAINKLHRELCYYKVDKLPLNQFRVIQNDTIVYFDRINYSDTKINRLYIKAIFIP